MSATNLFSDHHLDQALAERVGRLDFNELVELESNLNTLWLETIPSEKNLAIAISAKPSRSG